jgi:lipopolysaccharide/colanic/teichoic acid biosynthesis glycosyltransferase
VTGVALEHEDGIAVQRARMVTFAFKRFEDLLIAAAVLVVLAPMLLLIALAIELDSPGPAIFTQARMGARRRVRRGFASWEATTFRVFKFRTMVLDADPAVHEAHIDAFVNGGLRADAGTDAAFKLRDDPRVTRVGRFLRRSSLDELPQLVNVLLGDMSLVGPRPVPVYEAARYGEPERMRFGALPGITGLWQVSGRCALPFDDMIRLDLEYVRKQSLWFDLKILLRTVPAILSGRGAG